MPSNYQPNIPTGTVPLDQDYLNVQGNFQQLDTSFGVDHFPFSNTTGNNGYHGAVHLSQQSVVPTPVSTSGEIYSKIATQIISDTALFYQTGTGINVQMTMNVLPLAGANGYTFLPGGLLMQWGVVTLGGGSNQSGTVTFATSNIAFPTNVLNISLTLQSNTGNSSDNTLSVSVTSAPTGTGFNWKYNGTGSTNFPAFYWMAIGH